MVKPDAYSASIEPCHLSNSYFRFSYARNLVCVIRAEGAVSHSRPYFGEHSGKILSYCGNALGKPPGILSGCR